MLDFIHLSATDVVEIAKTTNLKGCPHTFVYIVYAMFHMVCVHVDVHRPFRMICYELQFVLYVTNLQNA